MMFGAIGVSFTVLPWITPILDPSDFSEGPSLVFQTVVGAIATATFLILAHKSNQAARKVRVACEGHRCNRVESLPSPQKTNAQQAAASDREKPLL